ncbi:SDR family NAD(P)-dependent oxidoreductase [Henriciella litoralis]|uniref:SDR family NAD(P)-dependent oxidoreductase n=1 Tax=Henriciella litoralis TaxID=568102 RepID=UPI00146B88D9|nr:SDR family oxidoreductase [Henriciella litoralis]
MTHFKDQTIIITGGATGLGAAAAELAARQGARVAVLDLNELEGRATADRVNGKFWPLDVSRAEDWAGVLDDVEQQLGPARFAFLNAGIMTRRLNPELSISPEEILNVDRYEQLVRVNLNGVFYGISHLLPLFTKAGEGAITVTSSVGGLQPIPFDPVYSMTKHGLVGLVRSLGAALASGPVRINAICPGGFSSDLFPVELRTADTLRPDEVAQQALDLLATGSMGEIRAVLSRQDISRPVPVPDLGE